MQLVDHPFAELFVGPSPAWNWSRRISGSLECDALPAELDGEIADLRAHLMALGETSDHFVHWSGMNLRVDRKQLYGDEILFICRRFNLSDFTMKHTGLQTALIRELMRDTPLLRSGLLPVFGPPGGGKSGTLLSILLDRLSAFGGTGWGIGCPVENPLQGKHGKGWYYNISVMHDDEIVDALQSLYRAVPNFVLVEEVRSPKVASALLRAAGSGWLIGFTFHANDMHSGIGQFVRQAAIGGRSDVKETAMRVADLLRVALYVELHTLPISRLVKDSTFVNEEHAQGQPPLSLSAQPLFFTEEDDGPRSIVRNAEFHRLKDVISRQRRMLMSGESLLSQTPSVARRA